MSKVAVNTRFLLHGKLEGVGFHIYEVLRRIIKDHPEIDFHFIFDRPWHEDFKMGDNVTCHQVFPPARHPILQYWWYNYSLTRLLRKINPDVFWSPDNFTSLRTGVSTVLTVHDLAYLHVIDGVSNQNQSFYEKYMPKFIRKASHILAVSEFTKNDIINNFSKKNEDITVCYNGCRNSFKVLNNEEINIIRHEYSDDAPYFIYLGSQHPRKNVHRLIQAFDLFKSKTQNKTKLIVAGRRAWMTKQIDSAIDSSAYASDIIMLDRYLDIEEAAQLIGASFCLIYPSLFEGFGIPILEGLNCEVPVITSLTSSMPEVGGDAALYVDPYSVDSIADAMKKITADQKLRNQLIQNAKVQKNKFTWDRTAEIVWKVIEKEMKC